MASWNCNQVFAAIANGIGGSLSGSAGSQLCGVAAYRTYGTLGAPLGATAGDDTSKTVNVTGHTGYSSAAPRTAGHTTVVAYLFATAMALAAAFA